MQKAIKFYYCIMTMLIHRLRFCRLHKYNQLYIKHLLVQPKRWGRQQSHFGTFSALQSNKTIPKVHIWKRLTHDITLHFISKYTKFFRDVHKKHLFLFNYYAPFQILSLTNTWFASIDKHQFSTLTSFYMPQFACSIHYCQHSKKCKLIYYCYYFYCSLFSYCITLVKRLLQILMAFEISRNSTLMPCLITFWIFCRHHHFQWMSFFVAPINLLLLSPLIQIPFQYIDYQKLKYQIYEHVPQRFWATLTYDWWFYT